MNNNSFNDHLREIERKKINLYTELTLVIFHTNRISDLVEEIKDEYYDDHCIYETLIENMLVLIIIGRKIEELRWVGIEESNERDKITQALKKQLRMLEQRFKDKLVEIERSDINRGMKELIFGNCEKKIKRLINQERTFGLVVEALEY